MQKKFEEHSDFNLSEINKQVLEEWDKNHASERSVSEHEGFPHFTFYEGPPSANGHPGIHHVLARTIKDTICRYKTMKGYQVFMFRAKPVGTPTDFPLSLVWRKRWE